jgi:hypothetical protein
MTNDKKHPQFASLNKEAEKIEKKWTTLTSKVNDYKQLLDELIAFYKQLDDFKYWIDRKYELVERFKKTRDFYSSGKSEDMREIDFALTEIKNSFDENNDAKEKLKKLSQIAVQINGKLNMIWYQKFVRKIFDSNFRRRKCNQKR